MSFQKVLCAYIIHLRSSCCKAMSPDWVLYVLFKTTSCCKVMRSEWMGNTLLSSTFFTPTCDECRLNTLVVLRMVYLNIINDIVDGNCNRYCLVFDSMQSLCNESREYECLKSFNSIFHQFLIILIHYRLYI